jgi:hypothetical protein
VSFLELTLVQEAAEPTPKRRDSANVQGTGTTIVDVAPNNQTSLFFQGTPPLGLSTGLSTGLAVLQAGFVLIGRPPFKEAGLL